MADLGTVARSNVLAITQPAKGIKGVVVPPEWEAAPPFRRRIALYRRSTGALIRTGYTGLDGTFTVVSEATCDTEPHFVISFDADGAAEYNAMIFDFVIPVALL